MQTLIIHFEKEIALKKKVSESLKAISGADKVPFQERLEEGPHLLALSAEEHRAAEVELLELANDDFPVIEFVEAKDLQIEIREREDLVGISNIAVYSDIRASLVSDTYFCLVILEEFYVCIRRGDREILHIPKAGLKAVFEGVTSLEHVHKNLELKIKA